MRPCCVSCNNPIPLSYFVVDGVSVQESLCSPCLGLAFQPFLYTEDHQYTLGDASGWEASLPKVDDNGGDEFAD